MTKQGEVREKYTQFLMMNNKELPRADAEWRAYEQLCFLAGLEVVLKVDRECEHCKGTGFSGFTINGASAVCPFCLGEGKYIAVESLIEEDK